jgi:hypothetical protein
MQTGSGVGVANPSHLRWSAYDQLKVRSVRALLQHALVLEQAAAETVKKTETGDKKEDYGGGALL